jgi:hypothetical protein
VLDKFHGLPAHVLLIHVVVVLVPVAALMVVASAVWPAARRRLGVATPLVALVALVFVPITTNAGEWLRDHLRNNEGHVNPLIRRHAELGDQLLPWAIGIFVMGALVWVLGRRFELAWRPSDERERRALPVWVTSIVAALAVVVAVGGVVQLVRIGDSGAKAAWDGRTSG